MPDVPPALAARLERYRFQRYVLDVAVATLEQGGLASDPLTRQFRPPADVWSFPKYPQRTTILPPEVDLAAEIEKFITANAAYWAEPDCWLGTWINPRTHHYYLDVATGCADLAQARQAAQEVSLRLGRKIVALYNSQRRQTVYVWEDVYA